jgi:hypothetical protein
MVSVVLGEMGCGGVVGDRMVSEELRGVSTTVLMAMLNIV